MAEAENDAETSPVAGVRFYAGVALFALSLIGPLVSIPLLGVLGYSTTTIASLSAGILVSAEVLLVAAAAIMGKSGYTFIKSKVFGALKRYGPPAEVSLNRYRIGLIFFTVPLVLGFVSPYAKSLIPFYAGNELWFALSGDLLLLIGLFILGGNFWDKLRALFIHGAKAVFPDASRR